MEDREKEIRTFFRDHNYNDWNDCDIAHLLSIIDSLRSQKELIAELQGIKGDEIVNLKECVQEALERYDRCTANANMSHAGAAKMVMDDILTQFEIKNKINLAKKEWNWAKNKKEKEEKSFAEDADREMVEDREKRLRSLTDYQHRPFGASDILYLFSLIDSLRVENIKIRHEWFEKGKNTILRKNQSGCCCIIGEGDELTSLCALHQELIDSLRASQKELIEAGENIILTCFSQNGYINSHDIRRLKEAIEKVSEKKN